MLESQDSGRRSCPAKRTMVALAIACACTDRAALAQSATTDVTSAQLPARLVQDFHDAFGAHHARAVHTKGVILEGRFEPAAEARSLSTAVVFTASSPMTIRFSDFTGLPTIPDTDPSASPRGMAMKFRLADGSTYDIVSHSFNGFPVATAADFSGLIHAISTSGPDAPKPTDLDRFLAAHPAAKTFLTTQKPPPESFATTAYFGVNAFTFTDASRKARAVRYRFVPDAGEHQLDAATLATKGPDYLMDEIRTRVANGPVRFTWYAQLAAPGDVVDDPSVPWPDTRERVRLGVITIDRVASTDAAFDRALLFLPATVPPGIAVADPMLAIRNAAYPISFAERQ